MFKIKNQMKSKLVKLMMMLFMITSLNGFSNNKSDLGIGKIDVNEDNEIILEKKDSLSDSLIYSKLTGDQIFQLEKAKLEKEKECTRIWQDDKKGLIIPIVFFGIILLIILVISYFRHQRMKKFFELYAKYAESGQPIPEMLMHTGLYTNRLKKVSTLRRGVIWMAIGLGIILYFFISDNSNEWALGLIPLFIGIGYIVIHIFEKKDKTE